MNRNTSIIITVVVALLCSCCSLFMCIMGFGGITGNGTYNFGGPEQAMPAAAGYAFLCLSIILIVIPIATGFFLLRKKPEAAAAEAAIETPDEPLPPTS
ncbi:MAG: hypothetical protein H6634_07325 [Anaerolineales bacterium]|nr:hypothetical protein [Anaerolineales bacterium]MCB9111044.1 hypothetical protein [Anaerolineales bacterium]